MQIAALFLLLCTNLYVNAVPQCCQGENIAINGTCADGSAITSLTCNTTTVVRPPQLEINYAADIITVTYEESEGYFIIENDKYCLTKQSVNDTTVAIICIGEKLDVVAVIPDDQVWIYLKAVCGFISEIFLIAVFLIYVFVPDLRDIEGKCIINLVIVLCIAYIFIIFAPLIRYFEPNSCNTVSFMYHSAILCAYNWLTVISFHLWRIIIRPIFRSQMNWFMIYLCYGYGVPLLLLVTSLLTHFAQNAKLQVAEDLQCWFNEGLVVWRYIFGPLLLMTLTSTVLQVWAAIIVWIIIKRSNKTQSVVRLRQKSRMYGHLLLVMAIALITEVICYPFLISDEYGNLVMDINDCRNYLLGSVTFAILVMVRNKVLIALAKRGLFSLKFPEKWKKLIDKEREEGDCEEATLTRDTSSL